MCAEGWNSEMVFGYRARRRLRRRCLANRFRKGYCRQCLQYLIGWPRQIEAAHLREIAPTETAPELPGQIGTQALDQVFAIGGSALPALLKLDDTPPDLPVAGGHQCVDAARGGALGMLQQCDDIAMNTGVVGPAGQDLAQFHFSIPAFCIHRTTRRRKSSDERLAQAM